MEKTFDEIVDEIYKEMDEEIGDELLIHTDKNAREKFKRENFWLVSFGLQKIEKRNTSSFLDELSKKHIRGEISLQSIVNQINKFYLKKTNLTEEDNKTREGDIISIRMMKILLKPKIVFSTKAFLDIHKQLFEGIYDCAGILRDSSLNKEEDVLSKRIIEYYSPTRLEEKLYHNFIYGKTIFNGSTDGLHGTHHINHIVDFTSRLYEIHPFTLGNTLTIAVFMIKNIFDSGFIETNYNLFVDKAIYFRNSLVRATYDDYFENIERTYVYLNKFYENYFHFKQHELVDSELVIKEKE